MAVTSRIPTSTETEVAVLQVQVANIETRVVELKEDIRMMRASSDAHAKNVQELLSEMRDQAEEAHNDLNKKINAIEKWRWMMMGAGIVLGSMGYDVLSKLLK